MDQELMILPAILQKLEGPLDILDEEEREAADEAGELDGNQQYLDLSTATWADVTYALEAESRLIEEAARSNGPVEIPEIQDGSWDERDALWHLELGMAAPVIALNALGAHTVLSCNGGAFGGHHLRDYPSIRFYPQTADVNELLKLARDSEVGLVEEEGRAVLYAATVQDLQRFATLALQRHGPGPGPR